ncbi:MAG: acetyl-CoA carboxylase biotin carboxyl carrier protein [Ruminococcus sp.]|nr:acetyl-CoA carboxylase biotin carboxyl carrier protein [Ruminococcus sp.]
MFHIEEIKELMALLENSSLAVLEVKENDCKVRLEKPGNITVNNTGVPVAAPAVAAPAPAAPAAPAAAQKTINAPIVGVFYAAPSPDSEPYVSVGKRVRKGDVVCIIEAMKCMNEIQAEEDGEITAVLATNGELVEYGQPLFAIQ